MERARMPAVAVCGDGQASEENASMAEVLGRLIVQQGCVLVCGGRGGVMEAACRGGALARRKGAKGLVLGILPSTGHDDANPHCDVVIPTGLGHARNVLVVLSADVVILVGGSAGTLSEAAFAWQFGKPVIALPAAGGWGRELAGRAVDARRQDKVMDAASPQQAVSMALRFIGTRG